MSGSFRINLLGNPADIIEVSHIVLLYIQHVSYCDLTAAPSLFPLSQTNDLFNEHLSSAQLWLFESPPWKGHCPSEWPLTLLETQELKHPQQTGFTHFISSELLRLLLDSFSLTDTDSSTLALVYLLNKADSWRLREQHSWAEIKFYSNTNVMSCYMDTVPKVNYFDLKLNVNMWRL